jgi:hypothetical protein
MEIVIGGGTTRAETINVSASGVYFTTPTYIEPLTKLRVTLDLVSGQAGGAVACDGVVVRVEPEEPDPSVDEYQVACYFTEVSNREALEAYVLGSVPF